MTKSHVEIVLGENDAVSEPLSKAEKSALSTAEKTIKKGWNTFVEVGKALATIRGGRLYRENYFTFEEYTRDTWQYGRAYVDRLIGAAETIEILTPIGVKMLPSNEAQVRPLLALPPEKRSEAWERVIFEAGEEKPTAKLVKKVANSLRDNPKPERKSQKKRATTADWKKVHEALNTALEVAEEVEDGGTVLNSFLALQKALKRVIPDS